MEKQLSRDCTITVSCHSGNKGELVCGQKSSFMGSSLGPGTLVKSEELLKALDSSVTPELHRDES